MSRIRTVLIGVLIVGFWLVMMRSLVRDRWRPYRQSTEGELMETTGFSSDWRDVEEWMAARWRGNRIGVAMVAVRAESPGKGFLMTSRLRLQLGQPLGDVGMVAAGRLTPDFQLDAFLVRLLEPLSFEASGFTLEDRLLMKLSPANQPARRVYWTLKDGPISLLDAIRPLAARKIELREGAVYRVAALDPIWSGLAGEARLEVGPRREIEVDGEKVSATRLDTVMGSYRTTAWVDDRREILRYDIMEGLSLERISRGGALNLYPEMAVEPSLPMFVVDEYTTGLEPVDLAQGGVMATLAQILVGAAKRQP